MSPAGAVETYSSEDGRLRQRVFFCGACGLEKIEQSSTAGKNWELIAVCGCQPASKRLAGTSPQAERRTTLFNTEGAGHDKRKADHRVRVELGEVSPPEPTPPAIVPVQNVRVEAELQRRVPLVSTRPKIGQDRLFDPGRSVRLTLADKFLVPPFTTLDARAGYWQDRKTAWLGLGLKGELASDPREKAQLRRDEMLGADGRDGHLLGLSPAAEGMNTYAKKRASEEAERLQAEVLGAAGRGGSLLSNATTRKGYGGDYDTSKGENAWGGSGTSIFDPVLCELLYRWFSPEGGLVLDPFAGGSVRGVVAGMLGRRYLGVDLRPEQVAANEEQRAGLAGRLLEQPTWIVGDARDLLSSPAAAAEYDFVFSCPPYFDLEVYSDDPRDLSRCRNYAGFRDDLYRIVADACSLLKPDRFAAFVVGEVRGKDGSYLGLVPDTIGAFLAAGCSLYNEGVLLTAVGSLPIRVSRAFGVGRKLGKSHQNVLVFVKGDGRKAADACGLVEEVAVEQGGALWSTTDGGAEVELGEERVEL